VRPPGPVDLDWQTGNASLEAVPTEADEAAATGAKAAAEADSVAVGAPGGQRSKPANWGSMTKAQRESWKASTKGMAKRKRR